MKILFICSSLEPGKDGVGDYTRKLAGALYRSGNEANIISLNDKYLQKDYSNECQEDEGSSIPVMRYSHNCSWALRVRDARACIENFQPDWISLQYVPYGFHKKGLPFYLPKEIKTIVQGYRCHIMFHEMWIGLSPASALSHKFYGFFQRHIARDLIYVLKPAVVTTTNLLYQRIMTNSGMDVKLLPLMSNISQQEMDKDFIAALEKKYAVHFSDGSYFVIGVFGTFYPDARIPEKVPAFISESKTKEKPLVITFGKNSNLQELEVLKAALKTKAQLIELGEMNSRKVSTIFSILHVAVLCTPKEFIGKSGAFAALRRHNVPVVVPSSMPVPLYQSDIEKYNTYLYNRPPEEWDVKFVAKEFLYLLNESVEAS